MILSSLVLFPQDSQSILINQDAKMRILKLYKFFINEIIAAIEAFYYHNNFCGFDAHVGETLCQIRAYKSLLLARTIQVDIYNVQKEIEKFRDIQKLVVQRVFYFEQLMKSKGTKYNKQLDAHIKLETFLKEQNLLFNLSADVFYLFQARILSNFSIISESGISLAIDYEKISVELKIAKTFSRKIVRYFQKNLAQISCDFVEKLLTELPQLKDLKYVMPHLQVIDEHKRKILPCYEVTIILLQHMLKNKCSVLMISHRYAYEEIDIIPLLFQANEERTDFELVENIHETNTNIPCIVIKGITRYYYNYIESPYEFVRRITRLGLLNIVLSNMAKHPQYSAKELEFISDCHYSFFLNDENNPSNILVKKYCIDPRLRNFGPVKEAAIQLKDNLLSMKRMAEYEGCCIENPILFFVKHIFFDTLATQLREHDKNVLLHKNYLMLQEEEVASI